jgi:tetratricopeptide (TPR) repeat protein
MPAAPCLDSNTLAALASGALEEDARQRAVAHLDGCSACRKLAALAAWSVDPEGGGVSVLLREGERFGRYVIQEGLGAGAMGVVYAALDEELRRRVAIKLVRMSEPGSLADGSLRARLMREAVAAAALAHPNVVVVHEVGDSEGQPFIAMELVEGGTMREWLQAAARTHDEILAMYVAAGEGLAAAHEAGIVHRDFKPDNVLVGNDGRPRVADFGVARLAGPIAEEAVRGGALRGDVMSTRAGALVGTIAYMSPEQLAGGTVDARSDQFAFAVSLYEGLYGRRPPQPLPPSFVPEPRAGGARVPAGVRQSLRRAMTTDPDGRFPDMRALLRALDASRARRSSVLRVAWLAAAVLVAMAAAATAAGVGPFSRRQPPVCAGAERRLDGVWDAGRRQAVSTAITAGGEPWASATAQNVVGVLDRFAHDWVAMRTEACEATLVRHEQSDALLDLRMQCLGEKLEELRGLSELLSKPDRKLVGMAARAAYSLQPLGQCADAAALAAPVPLPTDPSVRTAVEGLRGEVAQVRAMKLLGRYAEGEKQASALAERARAIGYAPLEGEALLVWGDFIERIDDYPRAADTLRDALWASENGRDRKQAARVLAELVWVVGHEQGQHAQAHEYAKHGRALLRGLGGDAEIEAALADAEGTLLCDEGHDLEGEQSFREALDKRTTVFGRLHPLRGVALANVAVALNRRGRLDEALALNEEALAVYRETLGDHHPLYGQTLFNIADSLRQLDRLDEARQKAEAALALFEQVLGPEHALVASAENNLGLIANAGKHYEDAERHLRRALAVAEKARGPEHIYIANYATALAEALAGQGRHAEAVPLFRRALAVYAKNGEDPMLIARTRSGLASSLLATGAATEALAMFEAALAWQEPNEKLPRQLADTRFGASRALWATGRDKARSLWLAEQAIQGYESAGPPAEDDLLAARRWHDGRR